MDESIFFTADDELKGLALLFKLFNFNLNLG